MKRSLAVGLVCFVVLCLFLPKNQTPDPIQYFRTQVPVKCKDYQKLGWWEAEALILDCEGTYLTNEERLGKGCLKGMWLRVPLLELKEWVIIRCQNNFQVLFSMLENFEAVNDIVSSAVFYEKHPLKTLVLFLEGFSYGDMKFFEKTKRHLNFGSGYDYFAFANLEAWHNSSDLASLLLDRENTPLWSKFREKNFITLAASPAAYELGLFENNYPDHPLFCLFEHVDRVMRGNPFYQESHCLDHKSLEGHIVSYTQRFFEFYEDLPAVAFLHFQKHNIDEELSSLLESLKAYPKVQVYIIGNGEWPVIYQVGEVSRVDSSKTSLKHLRDTMLQENFVE